MWRGTGTSENASLEVTSPTMTAARRTQGLTTQDFGLSLSSRRFIMVDMGKTRTRKERSSGAAEPEKSNV